MNEYRARKHIGVIYGGRMHRQGALTAGNRIFVSLKRSGYTCSLIDTESPRFVDEVSRINLAYIAQFGMQGDDGSLQGFLAILGIPYTGSGIAAAAVRANKVISKMIFQANGLLTPRFTDFDPETGPTEEATRIIDLLGLPVIVKPVLLGGSYGVSLSHSTTELIDNISKSLKYAPLFAEQFVAGPEITVGIIDREAPPVIELEYANNAPFLDELRTSARCTRGSWRPHEMVLCVDEKTSLQPRTRKSPTLAARPGLPVRVEHEYERKGALNLFAAFDTRTGVREQDNRYDIDDS